MWVLGKVCPSSVLGQLLSPAKGRAKILSPYCISPGVKDENGDRDGQVGCVSFKLEQPPEALFSYHFHHLSALLSTVPHLPATGLCSCCLAVISDH